MANEVKKFIDYVITFKLNMHEHDFIVFQISSVVVALLVSTDIPRKNLNH